MTTVRPLGKALIGLSFLVLVAACAAPPVEECEPGVSEISKMGTVISPGC